MNKKILVAAAAISLLAVACGAKTAVQTTVTPTAAPSPSPAMSQMSMKDIMMGGKSQKCEVNNSTANVQSQGTVYFGNGKMRGDFTTTVNGKAETSHMINDGTTVYTWVDGMAMAMKMSATTMTDLKAKAPQQSHQAVDPNAKYDYKCSGWSGDPTMFNLPKGINFTDMSALMNAAAKTPPVDAQAGAKASANASACLACNSAGAGKAQCLAALNCK